MFGTNDNATTTGNHHVLDGQLGALKEGIRKLAVKISNEPSISRARAAGVKATDWMKAHPFITAGIALGVAVAIVRGLAGHRAKSWIDEREPRSSPH